MPDPALETELQEIRDALKEEKQTLQEIKTAQSHGFFGRPRWRYLLIMGLIVLCAGGYLAYRYYLILKSITDQTPD
jgi:hypothetical protein